MRNDHTFAEYNQLQTWTSLLAAEHRILGASCLSNTKDKHIFQANRNTGAQDNIYMYIFH